MIKIGEYFYTMTEAAKSECKPRYYPALDTIWETYRPAGRACDLC